MSWVNMIFIIYDFMGVNMTCKTYSVVGKYDIYNTISPITYDIIDK